MGGAEEKYRKNKRRKKGGEQCNMAETHGIWKGKEQNADVCICSSCLLDGYVAN